MDLMHQQAMDRYSDLWGPYADPWGSGSHFVSSGGAPGYGVPFVAAAAPAIVAGIAKAAATVTGAAVGIASAIHALSRLERREVMEARAAGASAEEIRAIKDRFKRKRRALREKRRAKRLAKRRGKRIPVRTRDRRERRRRPMEGAQDYQKAAEILRRFSAGAATTADVAQRIQMGVEEVHEGTATDPFTGRPVIHRAGMQPAPAPLPEGPPPALLPWWKRPLWGGIPTYVYLGGAAVVTGAILLRRRG